MIRKHFAFTREPFTDGIEADELFEHRAHAEAGARIRHLLDLRGIGLLTGEVGCGKTTACRHVISTLHSGLYRVGYVALTTGSVLDIYNMIAWAFGLEVQRSRAAAYSAIRAEISRLAREARQTPVLVVDEAQHLRPEILEELRLLTNYDMDSDNRLCLLLVGLSEIRKRLAMAMCESLAQRLVVRCHLGGLERDEVEPYLKHRLKLAGAADVPVFAPNAVEALAQAARGMPRRVNRIAHYALCAAAAGDVRQVDIEHVQSAVEELSP